MSQAHADRNLLFGILALQMDFISRDQLIAAMNAWVLDKARPLGQILREQGTLRNDTEALLEALVRKHLELHGNDVQQSLAGLGPVQEEFQQVADAEVQASLARVAVNRTESHPDSTGPYVPPATLPATARFQVLRAHARGGLGAVFIARDKELNREVALKEIQERHAENAETRARFLREAEITGGLEHPGIVPVYGLGAYADGRPFYAMRLIRGDSLRDAIERFHRAEEPGDSSGARAVAFRQLLGRFLAVCNAMEYAHTRGVLHRDLKPANIMLGKYGETLIVDWGLAKVLDRADAETCEGPLRLSLDDDSTRTQTGAALGTPAYMSPEQAAGRLDQLGPGSDVYSLGATLYCLLTGRVPFADADVGQVLQRVQRGDFPRPRQVKWDVPVALEAICLKAMALRPPDRYASPRALADDLEHWLADEPVSAYREPLGARLWRWVRKHRTAVGSGAAALLILLTVAVAWGLVASAQEQASKEKQTAEEMSQLREVAEREKGEADNQREEANRQRSRAERLQYLSDMGVAHRAWEEPNLPWMVQLLERHRPSQPDQPDQRGFEWHYLWRLCHSDLLTLEGHTGPVWEACFSPDGTRIASAGGESNKIGEVKVWDPRTGQETLSIKGHAQRVSGVAFSPDGTRLASASSDKMVKVWDATTGQPVLSIEAHTGPVAAVVFSPDGKRLASAGWDKTVKVWDARTGQETLSLEGHTEHVVSVCFSPDGTRISSASMDGTVRVWDANTGRPSLTLKSVPDNHIGRAYGVCFSPDGTRLASASSDRTVRIWELRTGPGAPLILKGHTNYVSSVRFSPDSSRLASTSWDTTVRIWDTRTGKQTLIVKGHTGPVNSVCFSPDGQRLVSASQDGTVKVWDAQANQEALTLRSRTGFGRVACFSPDGKRLATNSVYSGVTVWDTQTGREAFSLKGQWVLTGIPVFSPDGKRLATAGQDQTLWVWDTGTGQAALSLKGHTGGVTAVAFSPDGGRLATASGDKLVKVWDARTGQRMLTLEGHVGRVLRVAFSPDATRLASSSGVWNEKEKRYIAGEVKVWDAQSGQETLTLEGHTIPVSALAFTSHDGTRLASAGGGEVKVWDLRTGQEVLALKRESGVVAFSPDGTQLATLSAETVQVWDTRTAKQAFSIKGHTGYVSSMCFSPDGKRLATTSPFDWTVKLWDAGTGQETLTLRGHLRPVESMCFSPDGTCLATTSEDTTVRLWQAATLTAEDRLRREAAGLIESLFARLVRKADVLNSLHRDPTLWDPLRREALAQAERSVEDPYRLNEVSWAVVSMPGADAAEYRLALLQAEEACRLAPDYGPYLSTLSIAQYRVGRDAQAVETLMRADKLNTVLFKGSTPSDLAFVAMAHSRLGNAEQAQAFLVRLQDALKQPRWSNDAESQAFLREAEAVVLGPIPMKKVQE